MRMRILAAIAGTVVIGAGIAGISVGVHVHGEHVAATKAKQARVDAAQAALLGVVRKECILDDVTDLTAIPWTPGDDILPPSDGDVYTFRATDNQGFTAQQTEAVVVTWPGMTAAQIKAAVNARPVRMWASQRNRCALVIESQAQFNKYGEAQLDTLATTDQN